MGLNEILSEVQAWILNDDDGFRARRGQQLTRQESSLTWDRGRRRFHEAGARTPVTRDGSSRCCGAPAKTMARTRGSSTKDRTFESCSSRSTRRTPAPKSFVRISPSHAACQVEKCVGERNAARTQVRKRIQESRVFIEWREGSAAKLPLADAAFDVVFLPAGHVHQHPLARAPARPALACSENPSRRRWGTADAA
jgi:Methyltransferase domain